MPPSSNDLDSAAGAHLEQQARLLTASLDSSRLVRADYDKAAYSQLAAEAQGVWRQGWPFSDGNDSGDDWQSNSTEPNPQIYHTTGILVTANKTNSNPRAREYVLGSLENVQRLQHAGVTVCDDRESIRQVLYGQQAPSGAQSDSHPRGSDAALGDFGYINHESAWVDAATAMAGARARVRRLGAQRASHGHAAFEWKHGRATCLSYLVSSSQAADMGAAGSIVTGAVLDSGEKIEADLTIVAAGAWSAALLPHSLGPRLRASGQPVAYITLDEEQRQKVAGKPVLLNLGSGVFSVPPPATDPAHNILKVAHHSWGYARRERVANTEVGAYAAPAEMDISIPPSSSTVPIPPRSERYLRAFLQSVYPHVIHDNKQFASSRMCWYTDTATGDFLIDYVPSYGRTCFVASGGSGHGFKFLPVLGDWIIGVLEQRWKNGAWKEETAKGEADGNSNLGPDHLGATLTRLWQWRPVSESEAGAGTALFFGDGSRGGEQGWVWADEMRGMPGWDAVS